MTDDAHVDAIELEIIDVLDTQPGARDYLDALTQDYADWKNTLLRRSEDALYDVLARCLRVYEIMVEDSANGERLRKDFNEYIKAEKLKFNGETHTVVKIARIVFAADSKKASAYGMVLRAAIEQGVDHAGLAGFIHKHHGIEKIRLQRAGGERDTVEAKANRVYASVKGQSLAVASGTALKANIDLAKAGSRVVLLATLSASGDCTVHALVKAESAVNAAFAALATETKKASGPKVTANEVAEATVTEQEKQRAALRIQAVRELLAT
jgi:hypothetical protein